MIYKMPKSQKESGRKDCVRLTQSTRGIQKVLQVEMLD